MALIKLEPWAEMERLFDGFPSRTFGGIGLDLAVVLYEEGGSIIAKMELPGIDPAKLDVSIDGDYLRVKGVCEEEKEEKEKQFYRKEICRDSFERILALPVSVDKDKVDAVYERGELKITMPRKEKKETPGKIEVKVRS